jgi:hypothetical protein
MAELVGMAQNGTFAAMGGWPAVIGAVQRKHHAHMRAGKARGLPHHVVMGCIQRMAAEDLAAIQGAARIMGDDEMGSLFSSIKNVAKKAGGAIKTVARKTAGAARTAVNVSQKLSPSHYLINKATGGMADKLSPGHMILNTLSPSSRSAAPPAFSSAFRPASRPTAPAVANLFAQAQRAAATQQAFRGQAMPGISPMSPGGGGSPSDPYAGQGPASGPDIAPAEQTEYDGPASEEPQMQEAQDGGPSPDDESMYPPEDGGMSPDDGGEAIDATQPYGG